MSNVSGVVQKNPANVSNGKHIHNYSTFDKSLSYRKWNTLRFGDYTPSFEMEGVPSDEISLNSLDRIDSLSLKAPFKGSIRKIKESFMVPNMAILPKAWDRIYAQNSNGDDVPADANCIIDGWPGYCKTLFTNMWNTVHSNAAAGNLTTSNVDKWFTALLRTLVIGEMMYSRGSLLNVSGYRVASSLVDFVFDGDSHSYDQWFDRVISDVFGKVYRIDVTIPVGSSTVTRTFNGLSSTESRVIRSSFRSLLELFRENILCTVTVWPYADFSDISDLNTYLTSLTVSGESLYQLPVFKSVPTSVDADDPTSLTSTTLNLSRILAYQLVCAHFYTNSSIDFIYSADLYREYIGSLIRGYLLQFSNSILDSIYKYTWNGIKLDYDYLSGHLLSHALFFTGTSWHSNPNFVGTGIDILGASLNSSNAVYLGCLPVWNAVFGFRKSLRFGDYFTASRPRPLAPINTDVSVNSNMVSVVDITRNIQAQRFANAVMRSRSKIEEYVKSLFGKAPQPDYHNPFFLARSEEMIFGDEVQNTADAQAQLPNSRTSNFAGNVSPYTFTFHNDDMHPCVYLQIIGFDVKRAYSRSVDRQMLHRDRFDMFNPDFQFIGDQAVYGVELGYSKPVSGVDTIPAVFSYQTRDMEYKQRFDVVSGGFVDFLPGWCLTDVDRSKVPTASIDPDFIRSYNTELDQFYLSLTGFSLGSYFHFTCITDNNVSAKRPMAVDPQILA